MKSKEIKRKSSDSKLQEFICDKINNNIYIYIEEKLKDLNERLNDGIIIANNFKALSELLKNCKTKEQVDLVYQ
jgi:hypothetical protein